MSQLIEGAGRLSRRVKLWAVAAPVAAAVAFSCYSWGDGNALPYHVRDASVADAVLVGSDNRTITLNTDWGGCEYQPDFVAHEAADNVTLVLHRKDFSGPGVGCDGGGAGRLTITLSSSLGSRPLIDSVTGKPIIFFDARNLVKPGYLPAGYREEGGSIRDPFAISATPAGLPHWTRGFRPDSGGGMVGGMPALLITQILGGPAPTAGQDQATVQGHPAVFSDNLANAQPVARTLAWSDGKYRYEVSAIIPGQLNDQEIIKIANGLTTTR